MIDYKVLYLCFCHYYFIISFHKLDLDLGRLVLHDSSWLVLFIYIFCYSVSHDKMFLSMEPLDFDSAIERMKKNDILFHPIQQQLQAANHDVD